MLHLPATRAWIRTIAALGLVCGSVLPATAWSRQYPAGTEIAAERVAGTLDIVGGRVDIAELDILVNGRPAGATPDGAFEAPADRADHYQIRVSGPGIFSSTFVFGRDELARDQERLKLPRLEIVARAPGRVELFFGGDAMIGRRFVEPIWGERVLVREETRRADMQNLLEPMRPFLEGSDLASLNLETVLASAMPGESPGKSVVFHTHRDAAPALAAAGIDYVSLGNNHVYDYLDAGLDSTIAALDEARIAWSGAGVDERKALEAARLDVGGTPVSMLGFVGWKGRVEPNQVAESGKAGAAFGSDENIRASVAREVAAGRVPIVQYHGSTEYGDRPTEISERRMKLAIDEGAALVVSHHPHVLQGMELYKGRLIAYSLGNFLFDQYFPETHASMALKVWMDGDRLFRAEAVPIQILDYRPVPAVGGFRQSILRRIIALSEERGTGIRISGGHAVVAPDSDGAHAGAAACPAHTTSGIAVYRFDIAQPQARCTPPAGKSRYGRDLLMRGDFEATGFADAVDRSWEIGGADLEFADDALRGAKAVNLRAGAEPVVTMAPKTFFRSPQSRHYSLAGWIKTDGPVQVEALLQMHPKGANRFEALKSSPLRPVGATTLTGGEWQAFRFDIDVDEAEMQLPLRPYLRISGARQIAMDDLMFVAWQSPGSSDTHAFYDSVSIEY